LTVHAVHVRPSGAYPAAKIIYAGRTYPGVVGRGGVTKSKREGDGATPVGCFSILRAYYRPDRIVGLDTRLPTSALEPADVWVDDPRDKNYNQPLKRSELEEGSSHEEMWREDAIYDIVLDLSYNRNPASKGEGSAVFVHVAREENPASSPTDGCVALRREHLVELLSLVTPDTLVCIHAQGNP